VATVLIVESDPLQGFLSKSILERQFLDVVRVSDAAEALCLVEQPQFARRLGLVIASNPMQGIGGPAFVAELHSRLPQIPILVLGDSGNPGAAAASTSQASIARVPESRIGDLNGAWIRFLPRPFSMDQLLDLTGEMLPQPKLKTA
jgi:DNA-binding NtrC family response regulator